MHFRNYAVNISFTFRILKQINSSTKKSKNKPFTGSHRLHTFKMFANTQHDTHTSQQQCGSQTQSRCKWMNRRSPSWMESSVFTIMLAGRCSAEHKVGFIRSSNTFLVHVLKESVIWSTHTSYVFVLCLQTGQLANTRRRSRKKNARFFQPKFICDWFTWLQRPTSRWTRISSRH